jgi:hypothetical protein
LIAQFRINFRGTSNNRSLHLILPINFTISLSEPYRPSVRGCGLPHRTNRAEILRLCGKPAHESPCKNLAAKDDIKTPLCKLKKLTGTGDRRHNRANALIAAFLTQIGENLPPTPVFLPCRGEGL